MAGVAAVTTVPACGGNVTMPKPASQSPVSEPGPHQPQEQPSETVASSAPTAVGVTATSIKIGQSIVYSGPLSMYGVIGKGEAAYFRMLNEHGGINGRTIELISLDDGYSPATALENTRALVENDGVAFVFGGFGNALNIAVQKYLNGKGVPQLFIATGLERWADPSHFPWTMSFDPSYRIEARVFAMYLKQHRPNARLCVLYQDDEFGNDYLDGLHDALTDMYDRVVVKTAAFNPTDANVDAQIVELQHSGCDALLSAALPKFAALTIRKLSQLQWHPFHMMSSIAAFLPVTFGAAGHRNSTGVVTATYLKSTSDPSLANDAGLQQYRAFVQQYIPDVDPDDRNLIYAFGVSQVLQQVLAQCGNDLTRENIMRQAANLHHLAVSVLASGIEVNTSPRDFRPVSQLRLVQFDGNTFQPFSEVYEGD